MGGWSFHQFFQIPVPCWSSEHQHWCLFKTLTQGSVWKGLFLLCHITKQLVELDNEEEISPGVVDAIYKGCLKRTNLLLDSSRFVILVGSLLTAVKVLPDSYPVVPTLDNIWLGGKHKQQDKWEQEVYIAGDCPVYFIKPETSHGPTCTLEWDLKLHCSFLPVSPINHLTADAPVKDYFPKSEKLWPCNYSGGRRYLIVLFSGGYPAKWFEERACQP